MRLQKVYLGAKGTDLISTGGPASTYEVGQTQENLEQHTEDTLRF